MSVPVFSSAARNLPEIVTDSIAVMPAKPAPARFERGAGIQIFGARLDPRFRGNDGRRSMRTFVWLLMAILLLASTIVSAAPAPGAAAPDFTLKSDAGRNLKLSELRGEVVMINFWATWCAPCREEMPLLNQLYEQYRKVGFTLLAVNIDDEPAKARAMARKLGVGFPVLFDTDKRVSRLYDVAAMPSTLLIDRDGRVRYVHRGYVAGVEEKYRNQIRELLAQ